MTRGMLEDLLSEVEEKLRLAEARNMDLLQLHRRIEEEKAALEARVAELEGTLMSIEILAEHFGVRKSRPKTKDAG